MPGAGERETGDRVIAMIRFGISTLVLAVFAGVGLGQDLSFEKSVLPIFQAKCLNCHGEKRQRAGLDLRSKAALVKGGESGTALKPGALKESLLWEKIRTDEMPEGKVKLTPQEKDLIRRWIEAGAPGNDAAPIPAGPDLSITDEDRAFWAFRTPTRPEVPRTKWANPVDAFLATALEKKGLAFSPAAAPLVLLRRVTFDLTGLPPTPKEIEAFEADCTRTSPRAAYERVVDRLLASQHYGERWGRHWLDLAGYADSEGILDADYVRSAAWRYRDYVIRAFNEDKPYDRFLQEQIAGDELVDYWSVHQSAPELPPAVVDALVATGYLRCASDTSRPDFVNIKNAPGYYYQTLDDTLKIVASGTMGLTLQCAKCHAHKYDPIPQVDYYRMQAIFMSGYRPTQWVPQVQRKLQESTALQEKEAKELAARLDVNLAPLKKELTELTQSFANHLFEEGLAKLPAGDREAVRAAFAENPMKRTAAQKQLVDRHQADLKPVAAILAKKLVANSAYKAKQQKIAEAIKAIESQKRVFPEIRAFYDLPGDAKTPLLKRGDYTQPGAEVTPGVLRVLANQAAFAVPERARDARTSGRRLAFAKWLTRPDHPLTARVLVNRLWLHHFGVGLVATPDNFGKTGLPPSHPDLLDWLACEFMAPTQAADAKNAQAWTIKRMQRLIVTSAAYQQGSTYQPALHANARRVDPENRLLWRQRLRRLEGEAMRDAVLAVSGTLNPQMFGSPVPMVRSGDGEVNTPATPEGDRRSIYLQVRRSQPLTFLQLFDQPVIETNCTRREVSTVASQALTLLNSDFMTRKADAFAARILKEHPTDPVGYAVRLAFARNGTDVERARLVRFVEQQTEQHARTQPTDARRRALADLCHMLLSANEFAYVD